MVTGISILGSTGSIGRQTAEAAGRLGIPVLSLAARADIDRLEEQARGFTPGMWACMTRRRHGPSGTGCRIRIFWWKAGRNP